MKFNHTKIAVAVAAAALLGASAVANAASFVRVPAVAGAQISNGGLAPAAADSSSGSTGGETPAPHTSVEMAYTWTSQRIQAPASISCALGEYSPQMLGGTRTTYDATSATPVFFSQPLEFHCTNSGDADVTVNYAISSSATAAMVHASTGDQIGYSSALTGVTSGSVVVPASQKLPFPPYTIIASHYSTSAAITGTVPAGQTVHGGIYEGVVTLKLNY